MRANTPGYKSLKVNYPVTTNMTIAIIQNKNASVVLNDRLYDSKKIESMVQEMGELLINDEGGYMYDHITTAMLLNYLLNHMNRLVSFIHSDVHHCMFKFPTTQ